MNEEANLSRKTYNRRMKQKQSKKHETEVKPET